MEIEATATSDLNFDSTSSSPYITAPSSPTRFGNTNAFFFSAPTSPSPSTSSRIHRSTSDFDDEFEFNFSGQLDKFSFSAADELFDGGKIRPLKLPLTPNQEPSSSLSSPKSNQVANFETSQRREDSIRGRYRGSESLGERKGNRSMSPLRVSDIIVDEEMVTSNARNHKSSVFLSAILFPGRAYKKWKLKDLLLFRSASDGRPVPTKESLKRYDILTKKEAEEAKNSSIQGGDSSISRSRRRNGAVVSAHELLYTENRAVSEELKRKTFLPYKQGWLGCLGFNPTVNEMARVGSLSRGST